MIAFLSSRYHFSPSSFMDNRTDKPRRRLVPILTNSLSWLATFPITKRMDGYIMATKRAFTCSHATRYRPVTTPPSCCLNASTHEQTLWIHTGRERSYGYLPPIFQRSPTRRSPHCTIYSELLRTQDTGFGHWHWNMGDRHGRVRILHPQADTELTATL